MATPYNLRSRRKSSQPAQESVRTSQARRKKHSKKDESEPERDHDQNEEKYFLSLHVEDPVENPKKRLILEDEENDESNEKQYNTDDVVTDGIEELVGEEEEEEEKEDDTAEVMEGGAGDPNGTDSSDDGDEAPEDVSLSVAKQQVLEQFHQHNTASER